MFSRGATDTTWGSCLTCTDAATNVDRQCDNVPVRKQRQSSCMLPVVGDRVALYDAVDTGRIATATLGAALPWVETAFAFGDNAANSLTGARKRLQPQYMPKCKEPTDPAFGKCIEGVVVEAFAVDASIPTPEENARDIVYVVSEITYKYPRLTKSYVAQFTGCCRLGPLEAGDLINNPSGAWRLRTNVSITDNVIFMETGTAASPFVEHVPFINVIWGQPLNFKIHAFDTASRPLKFRMGDSADYGVDLTQGSQGSVSQGPYGNAILATINSDTGVLTFPASDNTIYQAYYTLVVVVTTVGPCTGYVSKSVARKCETAGGRQQTEKVSAVVDFLVRVVNAGYTGRGPTSSCTQDASGLPPGSKVCNNIPKITVPTQPFTFICNENSGFLVTATDGDGMDRSLSARPNATIPRGVFAIRHRTRISLERNYMVGECSKQSVPPLSCVDDRDCVVKNMGNCTRTEFAPHFAQGDEMLWRPGNRGIAGSNSSVASGNFSWTPICEALLADSMYSYQGRHRLGLFGACFVAVDQGGVDAKDGQLLSPPACASIAVLRCTKPTVQIKEVDKTVAKVFWSTSTWVLPVSTNITFTFEATDDTQSRGLTIYHHATHGIPSIGAEWKPQVCSTNGGLRVTCNPVERQLYFAADSIHANTQITSKNSQKSAP